MDTKINIIADCGCEITANLWSDMDGYCGCEDAVITRTCKNHSPIPAIPEKVEKELTYLVKDLGKDRMYTRCTECAQGEYRETGYFDDMDGVLHCDHCGMTVNRWTGRDK